MFTLRQAHIARMNLDSMTLPSESQLTNSVLMIRPTRFQQNVLTAESNRFMAQLDASPEAQQAAALRQFDALQSELSAAGVNVIVVEDTPEPHTPDSIFPNNWVSFHADGRVVLYPMEAPNRRTERRREIIDGLQGEHGFTVSEVIDLSDFEDRGVFLEGTGSLVLDRIQRVAFACLSSRTHVEALEEFGRLMNYEIVAFNANDRDGFPIYHTNVLMSIGDRLAPICLEAIADAEHRELVVDALELAGRTVVPLSFNQLEAFAGNMLEISDANGDRLVAMSTAAWNSLDNDQDRTL